MVETDKIRVTCAFCGSEMFWTDNDSDEFDNIGIKYCCPKCGCEAEFWMRNDMEGE